MYVLLLSSAVTTNYTNLRSPVLCYVFLALSLRNMAASTDNASAAAPSVSTSPVLSASVANGSQIQYSMVLDHLIGDKRPVKDLSPGVMGGLPVPPKSDEQKMIERGMESCAFKSLLACVGGTLLS